MNRHKPSTSNSTLTSATATMEEAEALPPSSIEKMDPEKMTEVGPPVQPGQQDDIDYPTGTKLILIMASLYLAVFLVALVSLSPVACCIKGARAKQHLLPRSPANVK